MDLCSIILTHFAIAQFSSAVSLVHNFHVRPGRGLVHNLHVNEVSYERMGTKPRFEKKAKGNSKMAY